MTTQFSATQPAQWIYRKETLTGDREIVLTEREVLQLIDKRKLRSRSLVRSALTQNQWAYVGNVDWTPARARVHQETEALNRQRKLELAAQQKASEAERREKMEALTRERGRAGPLAAADGTGVMQPPPMISSTTIAHSAGPGVPRFQPRTYPATTFIKWVAYVLAGLVALSWVASVVMLIIGGTGSLALPSMDGSEVAVSGALITFGFLLSTLGHFFPFLFCMLVAESIRLLLDIQANTQESAHFARRAS